jgi:hypothetical protein
MEDGNGVAIGIAVGIVVVVAAVLVLGVVCGILGLIIQFPELTSVIETITTGVVV